MQKGGLWLFVKLMKQSLGSGYVLIFLLLCVANLRDGVRNIGLCNMSKLKDLC
jgi:hypothetical protein